MRLKYPQNKTATNNMNEIQNKKLYKNEYERDTHGIDYYEVKSHEYFRALISSFSIFYVASKTIETSKAIRRVSTADKQIIRAGSEYVKNANLDDCLWILFFISLFH
jgi:hypothetical protein